jgi:RHS repeat-associated protein
VHDDENQLIRVTITNATKSEFRYDGKMRRRERIESVWAGNAWVTNLLVRYVYDGNLVAQERHYVPQPFGEILQKVVSYTRGSDLSGTFEGAGGIGGLLARTDHSTFNLQPSTAFYHADGNGNVTCLVDEQSTVVARYIYDPYGNITASQGSLADANLYRFSSKEFHPQSELVYYLYRYYEPNLQRWINRDPLADWQMNLRLELPSGRSGFNKVKALPPLELLLGSNVYEFAFNNAIDEIDPWGLHTEADCEYEKGICDDGCRAMPRNTKWERFLVRSCWAGCMSQYAGCLATTDKGLIIIGIGAVVVCGVIVAPEVTIPILIGV